MYVEMLIRLGNNTKVNLLAGLLARGFGRQLSNDQAGSVSQNTTDTLAGLA